MPRSAVEAFSASADEYAATMAPALVPVAAEVVRRARLEPGEMVLDVGTGTGIGAAAAVGAGCRVTGVDAASGMLAIARREVPGATFVEGDYAALPFVDGAFDAVIGIHSLHFAADPLAALAEWRRVTRHGGRLSISWPGPWEATAAPIFEPIHRRFGIATHRHHSDRAERAADAAAAGWSAIETDANPAIAIRLARDDDFDRWMATGSRGQATGHWSPARQRALRDAMLAVAPRDEAGTLLIPFGALYLSACNP